MVDRLYLYGFFEDGNVQNTNAKFAAMVAEVVSAGFNAVCFTNQIPNDAAYLNPADSAGVYVVAAQMGNLILEWFDDSVEATIENARSVIYPIAPYHSGHSSLVAWNMRDDSTSTYNLKLNLAQQAYNEIDPNHPAVPMLVVQRQALQVGQYVEPAIWLSYNNIFHPLTAECDMFDTTINKWWYNELDEGLQVFAQANPSYPQFLVLQAHYTMTGPTDTNPTHLRYPTPKEMSILVWEAMGLEFSGLFWFLYSSIETWLGLPQQPTNYAKAKTLATAFFALAPTLESSERVPDRFRVSGNGHFISTFRSLSDLNVYYCIVVRQASTTGNLTILSDWFSGTLHDLISGEDFTLGSAISFGGGDGRMFRLDSPVVLTPPALSTNVMLNPGFETLSGGVPTIWTSNVGVIDTTIYHADGGGTQSLRFDGPCDINFSQNFSGLTASTDYYACFWMRATNLDESHVGALIIQTATGTPLLTNMDWDQSGSFEWRKAVGWFTTPANHSTGRWQFFIELPSGASLWVDDVVLCKRWERCPQEYLEERLLDGPVATAPSITEAPANRTITSGRQATLTVSADGTAPLTYQWYAGASGVTSAPISGATNEFYTTPGLTETASYWVRVSNSAGDADSTTAIVTVQAGANLRYVFINTP